MVTFKTESETNLSLTREFYLQSESIILVHHPHVDQIVSARLMVIFRYALVNHRSLVIHLHVGRNALLAQNVHWSWLA